MSSLGDGVKRLLTLHTQCDFFLSDWGWSSLTQLCTALKQKERPTSRVRIHLYRTCLWNISFGRFVWWICHIIWALREIWGVICYRGMRWCGLIISERTVQVSEALHCLLMSLNGCLDGLMTHIKYSKLMLQTMLNEKCDICNYTWTLPWIFAWSQSRLEAWPPAVKHWTHPNNLAISGFLVIILIQQLFQICHVSKLWILSTCACSHMLNSNSLVDL